MRCPSKCPCCGGNFIFDYIGYEDSFLERSCILKADHKISFITKKNEEDIYRFDICIGMKDQLTAHFWCYIKKILFDRNFNYKPSSSNSSPLPWFDPDFSDYKKLVEKLKTYIVMS